jgi:hypothetical protein
MAETYPIPKYTAYIWLAGDNLMLGLPPSDGHERGHTVVIPLAKCASLRPIGDWESDHGVVDLSRYAATVGFTTLLSVLAERERAGRISPRLGERSEPTQYNIEQILRRVTKYTSNGRAAPTSLDDLGLGDD